MNYLTKGEFIQALKDYHYVENMLNEEHLNHSKLYYLRYEKVKSPLDYEIVGYDKKGSAIREIKGRVHVEQGAISDSQALLDKQLLISQEKLLLYRKVLDKCDNELSLISEPLKTMLILRYKEHYKLKYLCNKYKELYLDESGMYKYIMRELNKYYTPNN